MIKKPTHRTELFQEYIPYDAAEGEGFRLQGVGVQEIYIFDDYGGWVDKELNYYDKNGDPSGFFDNDYNFYDMHCIRIPGGYTGGLKIERRRQEKLHYIDKQLDKEKQKFGNLQLTILVVEIQNLPQATTPSQIISYILERCNVVQEMLEECKKVQKDASKGYVVVRGASVVQKLLILEGRRFRIKDKDGKYICKEIQLFVRESKFGNQPKFQKPKEEPEDDQTFKIMFENLDPKKTDEEFIIWICNSSSCTKADLTLSRTIKKSQGYIIVEDENLMFRILKHNGRRFGDSAIRLEQNK